MKFGTGVRSAAVPNVTIKVKVTVKGHLFHARPIRHGNDKTYRQVHARSMSSYLRRVVAPAAAANGFESTQPAASFRVTSAVVARRVR